MYYASYCDIKNVYERYTFVVIPGDIQLRLFKDGIGARAKVGEQVASPLPIESEAWHKQFWNRASPFLKELIMPSICDMHSHE